MFEPTAPGPPISWNPALANAFMYRMPMPNIPNPDILPLPLSRPPLETASEPSLPAAVPDDVSMKPQPVDFPSLPSLSLRTKRPAVRGRDERAASMVVPPSVPLPPLPLSTAGASHAGNATPGSLPEMSGLEQQIKENELKGAKKHKAALFELIETEKRYISDLRLAESLFSYRIQCLGSRDVVDKIFGDMPRIAQVNTRMYLDLLRCLGPLSALIETERDGAVSADTAARCASEKDGDVAEAPEAQPEDATRWPEDRIIDHLRAVRIGATLSKHIKGFTELYSQYKTDLGNAKIYLKHIADESLKWSSRNNPQRELYQGVLKAIKEAEKDPRARRLEFQDFLILPMQRLTKYPLLLQTLFKHTPEAHPDYKAIFSALGVALKVAKDVDRS
ncbi:hypothetical protein GGI12_000353 [Dipsacomyces acuminosporus]|nr:hypothetical protein GGI12_000353 [Dipsacomyces acuminosporus]